MGRIVVGLMGVGLFVLTSCGGVNLDDHYESADALRSAMESEGYRCAEAQTVAVLEGYGEELRCEEGHAVVIWETDLPEYVDDPGLLFSMGLTERHYLTSDTWSIVSDNGDMLDDMQGTFGGNRIEPNQDLLDIING